MSAYSSLLWQVSEAFWCSAGYTGKQRLSDLLIISSTRSNDLQCGLSFSPDITLCGWLGPKHQLTNWPHLIPRNFGKQFYGGKTNNKNNSQEYNVVLHRRDTGIASWQSVQLESQAQYWRGYEIDPGPQSKLSEQTLLRCPYRQPPCATTRINCANVTNPK